MMKSLYNWTISLSATPYALWALAIVAFSESSFFPIPPDILLIPMIISKPKNAYLIALIAMTASVLGGGFGYYIGLKLYESIGIVIINFYHAQQLFAKFQAQFNEYGTLAVLFAGITPFPYKVITIASGIAGLSFYQFLMFSIIARGARFFIIALLLRIYGEAIKRFIERHLNILFIVFLILLVSGFLLIKVL
ncbi:MAG: DedA family protein [Rhodobacteraceae bacterium]|nr:DedA family protein [Paracoccaceae bacterium]